MLVQREIHGILLPLNGVLIHDLPKVLANKAPFGNRAKRYQTGSGQRRWNDLQGKIPMLMRYVIRNRYKLDRSFLHCGSEQHGSDNGIYRNYISHCIQQWSHDEFHLSSHHACT